MSKIIAPLVLVMTLALRQPDEGYSVGDKVSDFNLLATDDRSYALDSFQEARGFIVVFTCNTCPYAVANEDRLMQLHDKYAPLGYPVIAINPNDVVQKPGDSFDEMRSRARKKKYRHVYLYDPAQDVARQFGATRTPQVYVLQKTGEDIVVKFIGAIDDSPMDASLVTVKYTENAVDALLAGREPDPSNVKAIGCTIKWKMVTE